MQGTGPAAELLPKMQELLDRVQELHRDVMPDEQSPVRVSANAACGRPI